MRKIKIQYAAVPIQKPSAINKHVQKIFHNNLASVTTEIQRLRAGPEWLAKIESGKQ